MENNHKKSKFKSLFFSLLFLGAFLIPQSLFAKTYYYQNFDVDIKINEDSTFDVIEKQTYYLDDNFGYLNRDIALKDIDGITDLKVFDGDGNEIPGTDLDIESVGKNKYIQWNFPRRDFSGEEKSWIIKYKVHGGISFLNDRDEIYWDAIPENRDVPIKNVNVEVFLPNGQKFNEGQIQLYSANSSGGELTNYYLDENNSRAVFKGENLGPDANLTIAAGFPKGIVSHSAYWKDFFAMYYGYVLSVIILLSCLIIGFVHWYRTEKSREDKRAIVPQYEPPENLRPAMAEVILKEELTEKGLTATIIDLAVRGYVKIEEDKKTKFEEIFPYLSFLLACFFILIFSQSVFYYAKYALKGNLISLFFFLLVLSYLVRIFSGALKIFKKNDYTITKIISSEKELTLEDYEKYFLKVIFDSEGSFSTKKTRKDRTKSEEFYEKIKKFKDKVYKEIELDTNAFEVSPINEKKKLSIWMTMCLLLFFGILLIGFSQFSVLVLITIISTVYLSAFIKYEARLSDKGVILKEDWLGFKMYLETAEKYRMQNLQPEFFEKYLPYAIIFGVEKKWAKAFESMYLVPPTWYAGSVYVATGSSLSSVSSFSPLSFSQSFTSSFSSAFTGGGGSASGGGGRAGGGGGGGGGGAG